MANANRFRLWLHPCHGSVNLAPLKSEKLISAVSMEERLSILSEIAASQSCGPTLQNDSCAPVELFFLRGRLVAMSRHFEELFAFPIMFSLIACHRKGVDDTPEDSLGLAGVIACTFRNTPLLLTEEQEHASSVVDDVFKSGDVWLLVVTAVETEEMSGGADASSDCGAVLGDAIAAFGRLGAICRGLCGDTFSPTSWENTRSGVGGTAGVALLRKRSESQGQKQGQERPSYAVKLWNSDISDLNILRETKCLLQVQGHRNISRFIGLFHSVTWTGVPQWLMLMEAYPRGDLASVIRQKAAFSELEGLCITRDVLHALEHIHGLCIIHRDVKLENVVLNVDGTAALVDFGLSAHISEEHNMKRRCGTPSSIAPEISRGLGCCKQSDIFGCGIVLYGAISATLPFTGKDANATVEACARAKIVFPDAPFALVSSCTRRLIEKMLRRHAHRRPSATKALHALEKCVAAVNHVQPKDAESPVITSLHESCEYGLHAVDVSRSDDVALDVPYTSNASLAFSALVDEVVTSRETLTAASMGCMGQASGVDVAARTAKHRRRSFLHKVGSAVAHVSQRLSVSVSAGGNRNVATAFPAVTGGELERHEIRSLCSEKHADSATRRLIRRARSSVGTTLSESHAFNTIGPCVARSCSTA
eukprot:TRINITY_DN7229_c0_g2_i1.p1 TRINITY_DN7229_c0_g2~~TRINITY_DN7229_c0_g2_i1.p1  ORF type:complete len:650 (-),score=67.92 TRINITY_DN7229_c0_g2_i1:262-2211(-)